MFRVLLLCPILLFGFADPCYAGPIVAAPLQFVTRANIAGKIAAGAAGAATLPLGEFLCLARAILGSFSLGHRCLPLDAAYEKGPVASE